MIPERVRNAQRVLVIGGARSGKSTLAERLLASESAEYVATSLPDAGDPEWMARLEEHRRRRPAHWTTHESTDLCTLLDSDGPPLLIDCLTVWLTRLMDRCDAWNDDAWPQAEPMVRAQVQVLAQSLESTSRRVVMVTNEVGQGVVPASVSVRRFRDQMGWANQQIAAKCDEVVWATAGRFALMERWT